jgi:hypothetical protein
MYTLHIPPNKAENFLIITSLWRYWVLWQIKIEICESIKFYPPKKKERKKKLTNQPTTYQKKLTYLLFQNISISLF